MKNSIKKLSLPVALIFSLLVFAIPSSAATNTSVELSPYIDGVKARNSSYITTNPGVITVKINGDIGIWSAVYWALVDSKGKVYKSGGVNHGEKVNTKVKVSGGKYRLHLDTAQNDVSVKGSIVWSLNK
ncbi:hypothetical protein B5V89_11385 [Heyndrickxia sporothermodurans]|uniref:hypothetical protein n=1 Tax=Heyndrickxia TaxID=2837504 RepID=UPI000D38B8A3|nr:hypothetical protein [Heyndrickxia sporothermodurans]PTY78072.1 hypothetical protein B5V89_11385 [Heyndrickxia sporothermodurans]